ncbi:MAG: hypothetical protein HYR91_05275 [Flavobacteriia bacterium]|nr:hypothetical protein [Flavobacteriia bacterium]
MKNSIWEKSKSLVVFYIYTTEIEFSLFKKTLDQNVTDSNIKELKVIVLILDKNEMVEKHSLYNYFSEKDISFWGKIKKKNKVVGDDDIEALRQKYFDLLICLGTPTPKVAKWINGFSIPNRIGVNCENEDYFLLNLKSSLNSIQEMLNFAVSTLRKIS